MLKRMRSERIALALLFIAYVVWAGLFIYRSSYVAIDGQRYFGLFDDAMISMRYAWNFAHGLGLVWNAGERVEGYSNLLMTLGMSLAALLLDKRLAVLAVQISGIPVMLGIAYLGWRIATGMNKARPWRRSIGFIACACILFYYPLSYWTLMGMETGFLTLLILASSWFGLLWIKSGQTQHLLGMAMSAGLAFLTRNDSLVLSAMVFVCVGAFSQIASNRRTPLQSIILGGVLVGIFVSVQTVFRFVYYGEVLPNTYWLKLTGISLYVRLIGGTRFVIEFVLQSWLVLVLAAVGVFMVFQPTAVMLALIMLAAVAYQIYAGGDPWETWRLLAPGMPGVFILAVSAVPTILTRLRLGQRKAAFACSLVCFCLLAQTDLPFLADMEVMGPTSAAIANRVNTNTAIAIEALTQPDASVGVIWAGTLPYYVDRRAVDFLGKSDRYISHLQADVSGAVSWGGMISVPGHNKYDLEYSIVQLQPTYIQGYSWGYDTVKPWVVENYRRVEYHGIAGTKTVFLLKDSPLVCWEICKQQYRIIPWPR